jgi:tRNA acetyltransferase TAN1
VTAVVLSYARGNEQKQKKQYLGGRGSGQVKVDKGKGFRTAGFERLRQTSVRGVLISCDVRSEGLCVRESMMAVREHSSRRYPDLFKDDDAEEKPGDTAAVTNVEDAIAAEAAKEKASVQQGPFGMIETKTKGLLFIEFHNETMDPVEICADCLKEVRDTGRTKTKYLVRLTPVLATCYAKYDDIAKAVQPVLDKYLNASMEATTYCIVYKKRSNEDLDRLVLIQKLAELVDKKHTVDLTMPKKAILIDVMTNVCCIGVCDDYFALRKYNVQVSLSAHPALPLFPILGAGLQKCRCDMCVGAQELAAEGLKEAAKTGGSSVLQGGRVSGKEAQDAAKDGAKAKDTSKADAAKAETKTGDKEEKK